MRRTVPQLPEPGGAREGVRGSGPPLRLLIAGDSAAAGVGAATQDEALSGRLVAALAGAFEVRWKLLAHTGATTGDLLERLQQAPAEAFDVAVTSLGVNDVTGRTSLAAWRRRQRRLVELLGSRFQARRILLSGLPPMHRFPALPQPLRWYVGSRARDFDRALAGVADAQVGCEFVGLDYAMMDLQAMAADGFHPGPAVYRRWADELARRIIEAMPSTLQERTA